MTRHIAHIIIEADTPLKVGSNDSDFLQDSPVQKDWNRLPMILGTSIAGVLRKEFDGDTNDIFGDEDGSKVIFSNALLCIDNENSVKETLLFDADKSDFLKLFDNLPIREHTAITDKGVADNNSKFDEEVVYKGTRFKFSIEMIEDKNESFKKILNLLHKNSFRLGGGSTKGFGKFKVLKIATTTIETAQQLADYSSSLNSELMGMVDVSTSISKTHTVYSLKIKPDNFFMFGSGFGDSDADQTPVYEKEVDYKNSKLSDKQILIPASSIKGALAHRVAFYYNKTMMEQGKDYKQVGEKNSAIKTIFGHKKELAKDKKTELGQKGKILISDCFKNDNNNIKTFDHVSIDRFTGGAIDGHLFQEKTIADDREYVIEILLEKNIDDTYIKAFELALQDICNGMLPLGGATTKGHGVFSGEVVKI